MKKFLFVIFIFIAFCNCVCARNISKKEEYNKTINNTSSYIEKYKSSSENIEIDNMIELMDKAAEADKSGNYVMALRYYDKMLEISPTNAPIYALRGLIYLYEYNANTYALSDFNSAIKYTSKPVASYYQYRGIARMRLEDIDGALSDTAKAIEINNKNSESNAELYCIRALLHSRKGDEKLAIDDATVSIKLKSKNPRAFYYRALAKMGYAVKLKSVTMLDSALQDLNYSKEQYLEQGNMDGYQEVMETYKRYQNAARLLKK